MVFQIILFLFFLAFFFLARKNLRRGIELVIFCLPAYLVRFTLCGIPSTALEIMIYLLLGAGLMRGKDKINFQSVRNIFSGDRLLFGGLALLYLGAVLSTLGSSDLRASAGILKGWFFDPFLFFLVYVGAVRTEKEALFTLRSLVFSGFAVALVALSYALCGEFTFDGRLRAFYESPNYLAMQLAPGFLLAAHFFTREKNSLRRRTFAAALLCMGSALLLTRSYGALLGVAVALGAYFIQAYQAKKILFDKTSRKKVFALVLLGACAFGMLSAGKYGQIVNSNGRSSFHSRLMIWSSARAMLADHPFLGIGPGTFQKTYLAYQSRFATPYLEWAVAEPHNTFLAFYLGAGLFGLLGFLLLLGWLFRRSRRDAAVFLFLIYFLVHGLVDTLYWKNDLAVLFFLVLGAAYAGKKKAALTVGSSDR